MRLYRFRYGGEMVVIVEEDGRLLKFSNVDSIELLRKYVSSGVLEDGVEIGLSLDSLIENKVSGYRIIRPHDPPEVWGAGITYRISRERYSEARVAVIGGKSIYEHIYDSVRPEIFFKDSGVRSVGHNEDIGVRSDSEWTLPEPELGVVIDGDGGILGYTIVNDVTARDIEAANPLYLPQAKIYRGSCSFGPCIASPDSIGDPYNLNIGLRIIRGGETLFEGSVSTSRMARRIDELIEYLVKCNTVLPGTLLMTGTGIVPGEDITLIEGDIVEISIEGIGTLRNRVRLIK